MNRLDEQDPLFKYCKEEYEGAASIIHRWGHIKRVAEGACWLTNKMGEDEEEQRLAFTAGLLHDMVRPITEEICHAEASAEKAGEILERFDYEERKKERICKAIRDHREPPMGWDGNVHKSVYLADKIFEHMGAYLDFRASAWAGELSHTDYQGVDPVKAVLKYYNDAYDKFLEGDFPDFVSPIVYYQREWNKLFYKSLKDHKEWAKDLAERMFQVGKQKEDFDRAIKDFTPKNIKQRRWKNEMLTYIEKDLDDNIFSLLIKNGSKVGNFSNK